MVADDDPEQRIRELERSLSDRASELGVGHVDAPVPTYIPPPDGYPPPPPGAAGYSSYPPPVTFGTPFPRSSPGVFRFGWLLFAIPVIGLVIAGISFVVFFQAADAVTSQFGSIQSANPSIGGTAPTVAEGGTVSVSGVSKRESVACDGGSVNVSGVSNTVEITGHCESVIVSGVENTVKVESADSISASGFTNRVTYTSGSPDTSATGDNVVARG